MINVSYSYYALSMVLGIVHIIGSVGFFVMSLGQLPLP
jgi:hypothetical protein